MHEESYANLKWGVAALKYLLWGSMPVPRVSAAVLPVLLLSVLICKAPAG